MHCRDIDSPCFAHITLRAPEVPRGQPQDVALRAASVHMACVDAVGANLGVDSRASQPIASLLVVRLSLAPVLRRLYQLSPGVIMVRHLLGRAPQNLFNKKEML